MRHKKIAYTAAFGMLWGLSELIIGTWLHILNIPFRGDILTVLGVWLILTGLKYVPGRTFGVLTGMGIICASMKFLSMGMVPKPNIYISIIAEAFLADIAIKAAGRNIAGYMLAGALAMLWPPFSRVAVAGMMLGGDYIVLLERIGVKGHLGIVLFVIISVHIAIGCGTGFSAWRFRYED